MPAETAAIVAARDEADRIADTVSALARALPSARVIVADDGSTDATAELARAAGAEVVSTGRDIGKGGAMTAAARHLLADGAPEVVLLCDGDLGASAERLEPLVAAVRGGAADLATAVFARRVGGGFGIALGFARRAVERSCGRTLQAPISGQRAVRGDRLQELLPFAPGFGMETGMNIDALRAGMRVVEVELDLEHRATGRTAAGFAHRGRQLLDIARAYASRR
ncbi:MAG: glycosyltransferase family 2 protein [Thermoleophilaceae bacterium]|nr:glycosyltransferase family 2 protein [Thermoleophilaceae bacterium]